MAGALSHPTTAARGCCTDRPPFLVGYESAGLEDVAGSDVGALMWQSVPYSALERRALLRDHELPLWNRFNSSGTPLLGQGISMIGDPLNMGVVLAGATAWAWDAKFVIAKTAFALGIGLTVLACTGHLPSAALMAFSSVFIGFFNYRINHPAIFSLTYSPWILYCWIRFVDAPETAAWKQVRWLAALVFVDCMVLTSGTVKEAYMLVVFLSLTGSLIALVRRESQRDKWCRCARAFVAHSALLLIASPVWFTFLHVLGNSFTFYDSPQAQQASPALLIGLFDDMFYRGLDPAELKALPSANFLTLFGSLWAIARFRSLSTDRRLIALLIGTCLSVSLAFGVVPAAVIVAVPLLANVVHIHNTFSVVAIVQLLTITGYGIKACVVRYSLKQWRIDFGFMLVSLLILIVLYLDKSNTIQKSSFFKNYVSLLLVSVATLPLLLRRLARGSRNPALLATAVVMFAALHWRHGMYRETPYDRYVMNPQVRANFQKRSPAVSFIRGGDVPVRSVGFDNVLFPGYNGAVEVESFYGCDALQNPFYRELVRSTFPTALDWRAAVSRDTLHSQRPLYDLLNVRYYLSYPNASPAPADLRVDGHFDLDIFESPTVWPRAFFTNRVRTYQVASDFVNVVLAGTGGPIAAIQDRDAPVSPFVKALLEARRPPIVVPAASYRLTTNTTTFSVQAPEKGIVVLGETYWAGDFEATLNGQPAQILRVNHAFKGVQIEEPGTYVVRFTYWPQHFTLLLWLSGAGMSIIAAWVWIAGRPERCVVEPTQQA